MFRESWGISKFETPADLHLTASLRFRDSSWSIQTGLFWCCRKVHRTSLQGCARPPTPSANMYKATGGWPQISKSSNEDWMRMTGCSPEHPRWRTLILNVTGGMEARIPAEFLLLKLVNGLSLLNGSEVRCVVRDQRHALDKCGCSDQGIDVRHGFSCIQRFRPEFTE